MTIQTEFALILKSLQPYLKALILVIASNGFYAHATVFKYSADCHKCPFLNTDPAKLVEPAFYGFIEIDDGFVSAGSGISADHVVGYEFAHANGHVFSENSGYILEFSNVGINTSETGFEFVQQGQAVNNLPAASIVLTNNQDSSNTLFVSFSVNSSDRTGWWWASATEGFPQRTLFTIDAGQGPEFSTSAVPLPTPVLLFAASLMMLFARKQHSQGQAPKDSQKVTDATSP